ncbi:MAG: N-acetyl-gamma-glutamyl-phosphate reductase [bacterium]|nr:N-acetyl-gamma-glutamyl-phosphate reductase [bacterium]
MSDVRIRASILGASGYGGGELLRLLLGHPTVEIVQIASARHEGEPAWRLHPNLRGVTDLRFCAPDAIDSCDVLVSCLPHGMAMLQIDRIRGLAPRIIDLSADFRLKDPADYRRWYDIDHARPDLLSKSVYGLAELHREELRTADLIACGGCNATAVILALQPIFRAGLAKIDRTVVEVKVGTSEGGRAFSQGSHHPERSGSIRTYRPIGHRHVAEMCQELELPDNAQLHFTATALDMVRGIHCVAHVFCTREVSEREIWGLYRSAYGDEPFIRIVNDRRGIHRLPDPRRVTGTHFCDIGFTKDPNSSRLVVFSAIDNLVRGAAGQAVQALNLMHDFPETTGLEFPGLHPL